MSPPRLLLKVLTGAHAGAEALAPDGELTLGTEDSCDLVLSDPGVRGRHVALTVQDGGARVLLRGLDGGEVRTAAGRGTSAELRPFEPAEFGGVQIAVGPADAPWPGVEPLPAVVATPPQGPSGAAEGAPDATPLPGQASPTDSPQPIPALTQPGGRRRALPWVGLAAALLLLLLFGAGQMIWGPSAAAAAPPPSGADRLARLEVELNRLGCADTVRIEQRGQKLYALGHVGSRKELAALRGALTAADRGLRLRVADNETLVESVAASLKMYGLSLAARGGAPGEVILSGDPPDAAAWEGIRRRLRADVPMLAELTEAFGADRIVAAGDPAPAPPRKPEEGPALLPAPGRLKQVARPTFPAFQSVSLGQMPSITLASGERLFLGASLPGGYVLKAIEPTRVVLAKGGRHYVVSLEGA